MNKALVVAAIVAAAILSPIIGMAIGETRSLILGLAPEEAVLQLADKIDQTDAKSDEASALIESLQAKVAEQDSRIAEYQVKLAAQEAAKVAADTKQATLTAAIASQSQCTNLYAEQPLCKSDIRYQTKAAFDKMLEELEISGKEKERRAGIFNECQKIIAQCD